MQDADALARDVLEHRAHRYPSWATLVGLPGHDHRLRATSRAAHEGEAAAVEALLERARALPPSLDRDALLTYLSLDLFELREARTWARNPDVASEYFDHLFSLLVAAHLPVEARAAALASRLQDARAFFDDAWGRFDPEDVPPLWVEGARRTVEAAPAFMSAVLEAADGTPHASAVADGVESLRGVIDEHARRLDRLLVEARGDVALGEESFRALLRLRRIAEDPDELLALGQRTVERFRAEMREAAELVLAESGHTPAEDAVDRALDIMREDHPATFREVLDEYRRSIEEARAFVAARDLAPLTDVPLDVMETPAFLRHLIPFAAYIGPARFATPRRGVYLVTPKQDLSAFPRADTRNVTVHEAWPGHHLQISLATERGSLAAFLCETPDFTEGWALYCEAIMGAHGYTSAPKERLVRARDALWRAVRIVLDVSLHCRGMTPAEAASRLAREVGMSAEEADAEVLRYTQSPAYNLSYMWGRLRLEALRDRLLASGWTERGFHEALLATGGLPVALVERRLAERPPA